MIDTTPPQRRRLPAVASRLVVATLGLWLITWVWPTGILGLIVLGGAVLVWPALALRTNAASLLGIMAATVLGWIVPGFAILWSGIGSQSMNGISETMVWQGARLGLTLSAAVGVVCLLPIFRQSYMTYVAGLMGFLLGSTLFCLAFGQVIRVPLLLWLVIVVLPSAAAQLGIALALDFAPRTPLTEDAGAEPLA
jgi:hypothetical protein